MSQYGNDHPHIDDHHDAASGLCDCPCSECTTSLRLCVCLDCPCESSADHVAHVWLDPAPPFIAGTRRVGIALEDGWL